MLYPAHLLVTLSVAVAIALWGALLWWAARTGHFGAGGEDVKYRIFEDEAFDVRDH